MILCRAAHAKAIDRAVFPGLQGGPHNHTTAGIAVALKEASAPEFKEYARQIVSNAKALAEELNARGFRLISGGTDNHLILIDTTVGAGERPSLSGKPAAKALAAAGIECNYNTIPFETRKPFDPSGIRIGTPSITSRGMKEKEMKQVAAWMQLALVSAGDPAALEKIRAEVAELCEKFPAPGIRV
jgi:glycine hydroxymethyltransferase